MPIRKVYRNLGFYKPMSNGKGSAFQFRISRKKSGEPCLMIEGCPQNGPKPPPGSSNSPFNWKEEKVIMMFNNNECGDIISYIVGFEKNPKVVEGGLRLIHDQEREDGNK